MNRLSIFSIGTPAKTARSSTLENRAPTAMLKQQSRYEKQEQVFRPTVAWLIIVESVESKTQQLA